PHSSPCHFSDTTSAPTRRNASARCAKRLTSGPRRSASCAPSRPPSSVSPAPVPPRGSCKGPFTSRSTAAASRDSSPEAWPCSPCAVSSLLSPGAPWSMRSCAQIASPIGGDDPGVRPPRWDRPPLAPGAALGAGAAAVVGRMEPSERERILARAHARATPEDLASAIARLSARYGSREAGVLALFCGGEAAQFAAGRAGKGGARLEDLARELPPSYERSISLAGETLTLGTAYALAWPVPPWA